MKAYKTIDNEIVLTHNERTDCGNPICDRPFTPDETLWHSRDCLKIQGNDVVIDQIKKSAWELSRFNALLPQRINEINEKTSKLITESGYLFKGQLMSSSDIHQKELEALHNNRDTIEMQALYPFKLANKDDSGFVIIDNPADIHNAYLALNMSLRFTKKMAGNALKEQLITKDVNGNYIKTLSDLENFIDTRS